MDAWERSRLPTSAIASLAPSELYRQMEAGNAPVRLDVRFDHEWKLGHVPGSRHLELGQVQEAEVALPEDGSYTMVYAAGFRASTAASVLEGGTGGWSEANLPMELPDD